MQGWHGSVVSDRARRWSASCWWPQAGGRRRSPTSRRRSQLHVDGAVRQAVAGSTLADAIARPGPSAAPGRPGRRGRRDDRHRPLSRPGARERRAAPWRRAAALRRQPAARARPRPHRACDRAPHPRPRRRAGRPGVHARPCPRPGGDGAREHLGQGRLDRIPADRAAAGAAGGRAHVRRRAVAGADRAHPRDPAPAQCTGDVLHRRKPRRALPRASSPRSGASTASSSRTTPGATR